jgi:hypothetical protein
VTSEDEKKGYVKGLTGFILQAMSYSSQKKRQEKTKSQTDASIYVWRHECLVV